MSGKDETDLVRNTELSSEKSATEQSIKLNLDQAHSLRNGDANAVNGDNSINSDENSKQNTVSSSGTKPSTPSNWVQFENEDDSDKVYKWN